jgi:ABC-2 type transport system permease protein
MKARSVIWEVARREFLERWRSRALRISSAILLALVVAGAVVSTLADQDSPTDSFGLVGSRAVALAPALRMAGQADARRTAIQRLPDRAAADRAVRDGDVDVAIVGDRLVVKDSRDSAALAIAQRTIAAQGTAERLQAAGLTPAQAASALSPRALPVDVLDAHASDRERDSGMLSIGILILFFSLVVYGQSVAASVTEEKSSRVIELLLTSLPPRRLLTGKVLGVGTLGVLQLAVVCAAGLTSARIAGSDALPPSTPETVALVVLWFVLGYAFFSVAYAALGALVSRQEDLEATTAPVNMLLVAAYLGANAAIHDPNGTWAQIAAFFPPLSPLIVPARVVLGDMGAVGLAAAVTVQVLATVLLIRLAATVYERSVLRIGAPMRLRAAVAGALADLHAPPWLLQGTAVLALVAGIAVGTDELLGIALLGAGVLLVVLQRFAGHQPRA